MLQCRLALKKAKVEEPGPGTDVNLLRELLVGYSEAFKLDPSISEAAERRVALLALLKGDAVNFSSGVSEELPRSASSAWTPLPRSGGPRRWRRF